MESWVKRRLAVSSIARLDVSHAMLIHVLPMLTGVLVKARAKLRGNDMEPVVRALIYEHIVPLLVTDSRLRNLAEKLGLKVFKARWVFAGLLAISVNCVTNDFAASLCLHDSRG